MWSLNNSQTAWLQMLQGPGQLATRASWARLAAATLSDSLQGMCALAYAKLAGACGAEQQVGSAAAVSCWV